MDVAQQINAAAAFKIAYQFFAGLKGGHKISDLVGLKTHFYNSYKHGANISVVCRYVYCGLLKISSIQMPSQQSGALSCIIFAKVAVVS